MKRRLETYQETSPEKTRETQRRRAEKGIPSSQNKATLQKLISRDGLRCHICRRTTDPEAPKNDDLKSTIDHVTSLRQGGDNSMGNLLIACRRCNSIKGSTRSIAQVREILACEGL